MLALYLLAKNWDTFETFYVFNHCTLLLYLSLAKVKYSNNTALQRILNDDYNHLYQTQALHHQESSQVKSFTKFICGMMQKQSCGGLVEWDFMTYTVQQFTTPPRLISPRSLPKPVKVSVGFRAAQTVVHTFPRATSSGLKLTCSSMKLYYRRCLR